MNLAQAFFALTRENGRTFDGRGFGGRKNVLPVEFKVGKFDLWPCLAVAFAARTGLLEGVDSENVAPSDLAAIVRAGFISTRPQDVEAVLLKAVDVLRDVQAVTNEAYRRAKPPTADLDPDVGDDDALDIEAIRTECDDNPQGRGMWRKKRDRLRREAERDKELALEQQQAGELRV